MLKTHKLLQGWRIISSFKLRKSEQLNDSNDDGNPRTKKLEVARRVVNSVATAKHLSPIMAVRGASNLCVAHSSSPHSWIHHVVAMPIRAFPLPQHSLGSAPTSGDILSIRPGALIVRPLPRAPPVQRRVREVVLISHVLRVKLRGPPQLAIEFQRLAVREIRIAIWTRGPLSPELIEKPPM